MRSLLRPSLTLSILAFCVLSGSCKLNVEILRENALSSMVGAERMFFLENIRNDSSVDELAILGREAAREGYVGIMRYLQSRNVDFNQPDEFGWNTILVATDQGDVAMVRFLVEVAGSDVRAKLKNRSSALMLAARRGSVDLCRYLLDRGSNVDAKSDSGMTALMYAAASGSVELARLLVERGADIQVLDNSGNSALSYTDSGDMKEYLATIGLR